MSASRSTWARGIASGIALVAASLLAGCAQFRLPAIDPSGERIFSPSSSTTLASCTPKPAFQTPPKPTPCPASELGTTAPVAATPASCTSGVMASPITTSEPVAGGRNHMRLVPARMVAPVGTEVVLVAGYCGEDGHFLMRQPVEWIMTQNSAGHFVQVGHAGSDCVHRLWNEKACKVTAHYATGWTSTEAEVVTRGTPCKDDDVRVGRGQTWISVTSPTEGTSHVTVWAPRQPGWERRRQTGTIHWIDAQWTFPPLAVAKMGEAHLLTTTVQRATTDSPIGGWLVRYQIVDGAEARFANGEKEVEVPTNASGQASVELLPQAATAGTTRIQCEIVRPETAGSDTPRLVVGRGETLVTWSAAGLAIQVAGPEMIPLNANAPFRITVTNQGDLPARDVIVSDVLPPNLKHVGSSPQGQLFGDHLEWRIGDLPGATSRTIDVTLQGIRPGDVRYCVRARSAEGLSAESCHERARVYAPALLLTTSGPSVTDVGSEVTFQIELTNQANGPLTNVQLIDRFDAGLVEASGKQGPLVWPIGTLAPGETKRLAITFLARQPGQLCHTVDATADGGHAATARGCVSAGAPPPGVAARSPLRLDLTGPNRQEVGQVARYQFTVTNGGGGPLANVRVAFDFKETLAPREASKNFQFQPPRRQLTWLVPQMQRDERQSFAVDCSCLAIDPAAAVRVTVSADQVAPQSADYVTEIVAVGAAGSAPGGAGAGAEPEAPEGGPATGDLVVSVGDLMDPVAVGQAAVYLISVRNERNVSDRNVVVTVQLPEGVDALQVRVNGPTASNVSTDGRTLKMQPVAEVRAGESLRAYRIEIPTRQPGRMLLKVEVQSWRNPTPITAEADTMVSAQ